MIKPGGTLAITSTTLKSFSELLNITKRFYKLFFLKDLDYATIAKVSFVPQTADDLCRILEENGYNILKREPLETSVTFKNYSQLYFFGTSRGWFLQVFDYINPVFNFVLKILSKKYFPISTCVNAITIIAVKNPSKKN